VLPVPHSIPDTQPGSSIPDAIAKTAEIGITPDPIPDAKDSKLENNSTTDSSDAMPDSQTADITPELQGVPDSKPDSTIPMPDCQSTNPVNTELDSQTTNSAISAAPAPSTNDIATQEDQPIPSPHTTPRCAGPRRAASSSSVIGADPIASSGDLAIDSDDVIIMPEDVEDDVLEIPYLNHDWLDKVT